MPGSFGCSARAICVRSISVNSLAWDSLHCVFKLSLVQRLNLTYGVHRKYIAETLGLNVVEEENPELRVEELPEKVASQSQHAWVGALARSH